MNQQPIRGGEIGHERQQRLGVLGVALSLGAATVVVVLAIALRLM